ncbi:MAG: transposase [Solirubrobacteraceae bacterium]
MGRSCHWSGCAPRLLCRRDLRGRQSPLPGPGPEHARGVERVGAEPVGERSGGVRGDGIVLGGRAAAGATRQPGDRGQPRCSSARAKTDKLDARTLASLLWRGELDAVWAPDERCRILRRRLARREQLLRARTRSKNEIQAVLQRRLATRSPFADLFGVKVRQ